MTNMEFSTSNRAEASAALRLMMLFGSDPTVKSIAILTPYRAQVCQEGHPHPSECELH